MDDLIRFTYECVLFVSIPFQLIVWHELPSIFLP